MLLNPSHKITYSGLPPDILATYVRYKQGTRGIIAWLSKHAPEETYRGVKTLRISQLADLAKIASNHIQCMPEAIHFQFRETIAARKRLSKYFRNQTNGNDIDESTIDHEYFTSRLAQIYGSLCECCGEPGEYCNRPLKKSKSLLRTLGNNFGSLSVDECSCSDEEHESTSPSSCEECVVESVSPCPPTDPSFRLSGDDLGDIIETVAVLEQVHELYQAVGQVWQQAGRGIINLITATAVTNSSYTYLKELEYRIRELHADKVDLPTLHRKCCLLRGKPPAENDPDPHKDRHVVLEQMQDSWKALLHVRSGHAHGIASCVHKPADHIESQSFVQMLTQGIVHLISSELTPDMIIRNGTPVYAELGYIISYPEENPNFLLATFALHLVVTTYRSYISALPDSSTISSCRVSALKLSQQAQSSLSIILTDKVSFPCRCPETISYHLENLRYSLERYTSHKCWDIFFQAPWVAGNQIMEILDMSFYYGMRLMRYRHYVGAVLHTYNVLEKLAALEEIPLLEHLCNRFATVYFPGGERPTSRFSASWARFTGARLKFKKGRRSHNHRESWCMAVPAHAAKNSAGFGIGRDTNDRSMDDAGLSLIMDLKQVNYHFGTRPTEFGSHLTDLGARLSEDTKGDLSILRLNIFAIFNTCVQIVSEISNATHTSSKDKEIKCICFAMTILSGGDRIKNAEAMGKTDCWRKATGERAVVDDAKNVLTRFMNEVKEKDWSWDL